MIPVHTNFFITPLLVLFLSPALFGQDERPTIPFEGSQVFRQVLRTQGLKPRENTGLLDNPQETVLIVFGEIPRFGQFHARNLEAFRDRGGTLLVASDRWGKLFNLEITGNPVMQMAHHAYQGRWPNCPLLRDFPDPHHPLFKKFASKGLATNGPSHLTLQGSWPCLAKFAGSCWVEKPDFRQAAIDAVQQVPLQDGCFLVSSKADSLPTGRAVILAGHGVFFNGMMVQPDNDNFQFAWNCIEWLKESPMVGEKRKYVVLVEDGRVITDFSLPRPSLPPPPAPPIPSSAMINGLLRRLEDENAFNNILFEAFGREGLLRFVLLGFSGLLLLYGCWRLAKTRFVLDKNVPLVIDLVSPTTPTPSPLLQREQALAEMNNYWEPAQVLVRQWFWQHAQVNPARWENEASPILPVLFAGSWWTRWRMRRQLEYLQTLAQNPFPRRIKGREFRQIRNLLEQWTLVAQDGRMQWKVAEVPGEDTCPQSRARSNAQ